MIKWQEGNPAKVSRSPWEESGEPCCHELRTRCRNWGQHDQICRQLLKMVVALKIPARHQLLMRVLVSPVPETIQTCISK